MPVPVLRRRHPGRADMPYGNDRFFRQTEDRKVLCQLSCVFLFAGRRVIDVQDSRGLHGVEDSDMLPVPGEGDVAAVLDAVILRF